MGMMRLASNNKIPETKRKKQRRHRVKRAQRVKNHGRVTGAIEDPELMTIHHLKKRKTSARANITLSGKKKRKLMKQLKHMQKDKETMEVEETTMVVKKIRKKKVKDAEMADAEAGSLSSAQEEASGKDEDVEMQE